MNYLEWASWGVFNAVTLTERANFFASWGLFGAFPIAAVTAAWRGLNRLAMSLRFD